MGEAREIQVAAEHAGERLDQFLSGALGLSLRYARRLLERGVVRIAATDGVKGRLLRGGERITVAAFRHPEEGPLPAPEVELPLLASGAGLLAFDKPAGLPTQPLDFDETHTAVNAALARWPELAGVGEGGLHAGVVHRLDRDTSGVLVLARDDDAWRRARAALRERRVDKRYRALVHGHPPEGRELCLRLDHRGARVRVVERGGREAVTRIHAVAARGDCSLVDLQIVTGVTHQIRATLAHLGHPVVGDATYGSPADEPRHWLHACSIRIGDFEASAPPPPRLR